MSGEAEWSTVVSSNVTETRVSGDAAAVALRVGSGPIISVVDVSSICNLWALFANASATALVLVICAVKFDTVDLAADSDGGCDAVPERRNDVVACWPVADGVELDHVVSY